MLSYFPNHSKHSKTTKVLKSQWIVSIWRQNDQKCWVTFKPFQTQQNYKSDQITMNCIDLTSKRSKMLSYVSNYSKHRKTTKVHRFDVKTIKNVELRPKPFQTQQNYKSNQIKMNCIDLTWKRSKILSYVPNHSKHSKTTKVIKLWWIASIRRPNDKKCWVTSQTIPNTAKLEKWSNHDEFHRFDV